MEKLLFYLNILCSSLVKMFYVQKWSFLGQGKSLRAEKKTLMSKVDVNILQSGLLEEANQII